MITIAYTASQNIPRITVNNPLIFFFKLSIFEHPRRKHENARE